MKSIIKISALAVVSILVVASFFVLLTFNFEEGNEMQKDTIPPKINSISGNITATSGKVSRISANFSDDYEVTDAKLFYRSKNTQDWNSISIINGYADIEIPSGSVEDWYYYVVVDDKENNGPVGSPSTDGSKFFVIDVYPPSSALKHTVFIEKATATWCKYCPPVGDVLKDLYDSEEYDFYYVSMVKDKNDKASNRLVNDYNTAGYPSVFIDGGYEIISGNKPEPVIKESIDKASKRDTAKISVNVTSNYNSDEDIISVDVDLTNYEEEKYSGRLKIYLVDRISEWQDYDGNSYHFAFRDYLMNEEINVESEESITISKELDSDDYDAENIMFIAVVFNNEPNQAYSNPSEKTNIFDAYYADACDAAFVVEEGNLPPEVGITNIKNGRIHIFGRDIFSSRKLQTYLFGRTKISAKAQDDSEVTRVEFFVDNELIGNITESPYEVKLTGPRFFKHDIKVVAYDDKGKSTTVVLENVFLLILI